MLKNIRGSIALLFACIALNASAQEKIIIFAAASLTNAMTDIANMYEQAQAVQIQTSFASSSALARQIEKGAPADIFISADTKWMDYLQDKALLTPQTKLNLVGNQLVLIAHKGKAFKVIMDKNFNIGGAFAGKLCTGELNYVPLGIYAQQALKSLNWWDAIKMRIVGMQDARAALMFVERGECDAGIVYATDAKLSGKVDNVAKFPETSHAPIVYPVALIKNAKPNAKHFYDYLQSEKASAIFSKYGFTLKH